MNSLDNLSVQRVAEAMWQATIVHSLSQWGPPTQVTPAHAAPEGEEADLVVWIIADKNFGCQKIRAIGTIDLAANDIHNPNYPDSLT